MSVFVPLELICIFSDLTPSLEISLSLVPSVRTIILFADPKLIRFRRDRNRSFIEKEVGNTSLISTMQGIRTSLANRDGMKSFIYLI